MDTKVAVGFGKLEEPPHCVFHDKSKDNEIFARILHGRRKKGALVRGTKLLHHHDSRKDDGAFSLHLCVRACCCYLSLSRFSLFTSLGIN